MMQRRRRYGTAGLQHAERGWQTSAAVGSSRAAPAAAAMPDFCVPALTPISLFQALAALSRWRQLTPLLCLLALAFGMAPPAVAQQASDATEAAPAASIRVAAGTPLQPLLDQATEGAVFLLGPGRHAGPVVLEHSLSLVGEPDAVLAGNGQGSVITIKVPHVRIEGLRIEGSGIDLPAMDSGVLALRESSDVVIRNNHFAGNLFGVYVHGAANTLVEHNRFEGRRDLRTAEAGNGVSIWNAPGTRVADNTFRYGRDGIFVRTSRNNVFENNTFSDLRFAVHYMYTNETSIIGNRSSRNTVGWAIMFSDRLEIRDNISDGDRNHGLMLNSTNNSKLTGNVVRFGGEKCVFVYNANRNLIADNWFEGCPIGIHFTAGSEGNIVTGNAFIANETQIKYVGTRTLDWAYKGRGNYWSDNPAFDLDGDGIADRAYRPNDLIDNVLWRVPAAKVLINSPAVQAVRWAQARFPAMHPGGVLDSRPLMRPVITPPIPPMAGRPERRSGASDSSILSGAGH